MAHGEVWICSISKAVPISIGRGENRGRELTYYNVVRNLLKVGDWNDVVLVAKGNHITYTINGQLMTDLTDDSPKALKDGVLAFQLHAGYTMEVQFKDVKVKVLEGEK